MFQLHDVHVAEFPVQGWLRACLDGYLSKPKWSRTLLWPTCRPIRESLEDLENSKDSTYLSKLRNLSRCLGRQLAAGSTIPWEQKLFDATLDSDDDGYLRVPNEPGTAVLTHFGPVSKLRFAALERVAAWAEQLLSAEPDRRFSLGLMLNVEGARFVKYERGLVSISEAFIFGEGATELFNFLLYIGFATEEELGYDKSIQRIKDDSGKTCFLYSISNTFYKTIDVPIYEAPPGSIPTEGCRVWNAQKTSWDGMVIDSTTYTLKDAWFDHRYPGEREMQRRILSKLSSTNASGKLLDHLLTIIAEESIRLSTLLEDITLMDLDRWSHPLQWSSDGDCLAPSAEKWENLHYSRRHWRSVYERCSEYPREVYDLKASLRAAGDIADALNLLRMAGFIHRNVSPKNLLMQLQTGHGLLSDLETAGEYLDLHLPSSKTTSGFTSIELIADIFLYPPPRSGFRPRPILHDHPYHDLESLYWVILFSVLSRIPAAAAAEPSGLGRDSQWRVFSKLFARTTQKSERAKLMTDPWRTVDILSQLDCDEDTKIALLPVLQGLLSTIVEAYQHLQKQPWKSCEGKDRWDPGLFSGLPYDAFKRELLTCIESLPTDLGSKPSTTSRT